MLDLLSNRNVLTQLAGIIFALLAAFHITLPAGATASTIVGAALLVIAAVSAYARFGVAGVPADAKLWWQSKTIWTAIVAAVIGVLSIFLPNIALDQASIVSVVMVLIGVANIALHQTSTAPIAAAA